MNIMSYKRHCTVTTGLPMTRIELENVADVFFPDRRALHLVDIAEIVAKLTQKHDWKKSGNEIDAVKIEREVMPPLLIYYLVIVTVYRYKEKSPSVPACHGLKWNKLEKENIM